MQEASEENTVRPTVSGLEVEAEDLEEEEEGEEEDVMRTEDLERIGSEKDKEFVRKLADPKLPSEEERR